MSAAEALIIHFLEKIILKPKVKEYLIKGHEPDTFFDVLVHHGTNVQEKSLGSLFVLSHLKQKEDELVYVISLVSSLAKREFFSQQSAVEQNPKVAFERTLKKLNEVLDDFFKNKSFILNLGLAAISADNIYISRLGKFKVALARNNEYIDILNNIGLFNKDDKDERQFSNIVSGKLRPNDKIFAYFPVRAVTSREKVLNPLFVSKNQQEFSGKIAQLASTVGNFSCCGVHINMQEIKEIPVTFTSASSTVSSAAVKETKSRINFQPKTLLSESKNRGRLLDMSNDPEMQDNNNLKKSLPSEGGDETVLPGFSDPVSSAQDLNVIRAELSVTKRDNLVTLTSKGLGKLMRGLGGNSFGGSHRPKLVKLVVIAIVVMTPVIFFASYGTGSDVTKEAYGRASAGLEQAQNLLSQNDSKAARAQLQAALAEVSGVENKKIDILRSDINKTLDTLDKTSDKQPELLFNNAEKGYEFVAVSGGFQGPMALNSDGRLVAFSAGETSDVTIFGNSSVFLLTFSDFTISLNVNGKLSVFNPKVSGVKNYSLTFPKGFDINNLIGATIYENNLYLFSGNTIYKFTDAVLGSAKGTIWGTIEETASLYSLTADGNLYTLTGDGRLISLFRGKKESELNIQIGGSDTIEIITDKNSAFVYVSDTSAKRVYVIDKSGGTLITSYKLDVVGDIKDIFVTATGTIVVLSAGGNVWQIMP